MAKVLIGNFKGPKGDKGDKGDPGTAATIQVGTTQTVQPEENAEVTNSGTTSAAVLNFKIPRGEDGMTDLTAEYKDASEYTCQPTVNAPVVVKELDGKTEQVETTGAQLFNPEDAVFKRCAFVDGKEYTVKSNIQNDYYCQIELTYLNEYILQNKGKSLTLSCSGNPSGRNVSIVIYGTFSTGEIYQAVNITGNKCTIAISSDIELATMMELRVNGQNTPFTDTTTEISNIMLNEGTEALPFELYTGGQPAPSPDYPQVIKGVGGMGYFDGAWRQGSYNIYGVPDNSGAWISFVNKIPCKANDNIKVSYNKDIVGIRIFFWNTSGGFLSTEPIDGKETTGWTAPATAGSFVISFNDNNISPALAAYCTVTINGEYQTGVESRTAQLFDASKLPSKTQGGATVTNNGDGSFTISGSGNLSDFFINYYNLTHEETLKLFKQGNITLACDTNSYPNFIFQIKTNDDTGSDSTLLGVYPGETANITKEMLDNTLSFARFYIYGRTGNQIKSGTIKPIFYQSGDGTYQPYHHTALSIPLTSTLYEGDKICYVKPGESYVDADGDTVIADRILYGCYRENAVVVFDGSEDENWTLEINNRYYIILNNSNNIYTENTAKCNFFKYNTNVYNDHGNEIGFIVLTDVFYCRFGSASEINSVSNLKAWLSNNPLTVVYRLAQPYFEPFTDQSIFYNLRTDDTLTYIYSNDPVKPNVTVEVAKNSTGGYLLESYAQAQKNAISEASNASRLSAVETEIVALNSMRQELESVVLVTMN